jgi:nitroimidazol reductase NimA-like FMN-containing flavoprotein (pyridoxamine 5'-phosphate oxidase superfamily)
MPLTSLTAEECWQLVSTAEVGRLAVVVSGYPEMYPVNFTVVSGCVLVRTDPGVKLRHGHFRRVCFGVDASDVVARTGWSVLVRGVVHELSDHDPRAAEFAAAAARIHPWAGGEKAHCLVITPVAVTGRRLVPG